MNKTSKVALFVGMAISTANVSANSLKDVYYQAIDNNPSLLIADAAYKEANSAHTSAIFGLLPQVNFTYDFEDITQELIRTENPTFNTGRGSFDNEIRTFSVVQPLIDGTLYANIEKAKYTRNQLASSYKQAEHAVAFQSIETYLMALASYDAYQLAQAEYEAINEQFQQLDVKRQSGLTGTQEFEEVKAKLQEIKNQVIQAAIKVDLEFNELEALTGTAIETIQPMSGDVLLTRMESEDPTYWLEKARLQNPEYIALEYAAKAAKSELYKQNAKLLPNVELRATNQYRQVGGSLFGGASESREETIVVRFNVPIFNSTGSGYQHGEYSQKWNNIRFQIDDLNRQLNQQVTAALLQIDDSIRRAPNLKALVESRERIAEDSKKMLESGLITADELLDDVSQVYSAKRALLASQYNYLLSGVLLHQLSGEINEQHILQVDSLFDSSAVAISRPSL